MATSLTASAEQWLWTQRGVISDVFERAADELESIGVRLRTGSSPPAFEDILEGQRIRLTPSRFSLQTDDAALSLALIATTRRGPRRYEISLEISGLQACHALKQLAAVHSEVWQRVYLNKGLWLVQCGNVYPLNGIEQVTQNSSPNMAFVAGFLHSELPRTIVDGVMLLGTLYRCVLDELCGASNMTKLCNLLARKLGGDLPRFQRIVRPFA